MRWVFRSFVRGQDRRIYSDWFPTAPARTRADVVGIIRYLRVRERPQWTRPDYGELQGVGKGLGELRPHAWRVIGWFGPGLNDFTILEIVAKAQGKKRFNDACRNAHKRIGQVRRGESSTAAIPDAELVPGL